MILRDWDRGALSSNAVKPLVLEIAMEPQPIRKTEGEEETPKLTVKVTIKADEKGSYAYEGQKLKFAIQATEVTVSF